jgi:hypothetical protein
MSETNLTAVPASWQEQAPPRLKVGVTGWGTRLLLGAALGLLVTHFVIYVVFALSLLSFPFDYDQGEGFELNDTVLLSQGQTPYRDNAQFPFYASNYPPLYHVILVPFVWLFGPEYWYGRLAGFAATLITAAAISHAIWRDSYHRGAAVLGGLAYLASNYVYHIGPLFRQHITMVMFETLAVVVIANFDMVKHPRRRLMLALALLLCAGYTKQLAIATVGAVFVWLALRGVRRAVVYGVGFALVAGAIFMAINASTGGQWWVNIIAANVNDFSIAQFVDLLRQFVGLHGALLIPAAAMVIYALYLSRISVYSAWFVGALAGSVLAGKWGAGDSYFATAIAAMCLLAGVFVGRCLGGGWRLPFGFQTSVARLASRLHPNSLKKWTARAIYALPRWLGMAGCGCFIVYGLAVVKIPLDGALVGPAAQALGFRTNTKFPNFYDSAGWVAGYALLGQIPTAQDIENGWRIVELLDDDPRPILSEEAAFSFLTGKPVVTNPTQLLNLYNNGLYDPAGLVKMIEGHEFGAVVFRARFYPQPVIDAVDRAYTRRAVIPMNGFEYEVLLPNPDWKARRGG